MANAIRIALIFLGLAVALFGIGVDFILPGASPGLNLPQILIIVAGLAISVFGYSLRFSALRRRLLVGSRRSMLAAALVTVITLLVLELLLAALGFTTYFPLGATETKHRMGSSRICDEAGCRFNYQEISDRCARGQLSGRLCKVNRQGFPDDEDFNVAIEFADRPRILALGDSFTQGFSAEAGQSFIETIEARNPDYVLWNAAISGTGTHQAVASFKTLAPALQPNLTLLGFYMNDYYDNLTTVNTWIEVRRPNGESVFVQPFRYDVWGNLIQMEQAETLFFVAHGAYPPANELERLTGKTRLGAILFRIRDRIAESSSDERRFAAAVASTRNYLTELRDLASSQNSAILVMLISSLEEEYAATSKRYKVAVAMMEELGLPHIDLTDFVSDEDYAPLPDEHWNSAGHQKVGALLSDCIQIFIASGNLGDCENVVTP